ncbi:2TM domain-containing protein [Actinoplanes sp. TBRC 11911]|uniref:2TM domain-containing protein n=1 Tax=Actinoplanes sp. TBRC 11911 TaxID=2729386 RepID=UPI001B7D74A3|nr:2TM domain-containing protein [Actinoplanes sp. TBRC 11911]
MKDYKDYRAPRWQDMSDREKKIGLFWHALSYLVFNVAFIVYWLIAPPTGFFWPVVPVVAWGIGLAFHVRAVYAPSKSAPREA